MTASHVASTGHPVFTEYTIETAPPASRRLMTAIEKHLGYLPKATARWAASPHLLDGFGKLTALFESSTLDPLSREVLGSTLAARNGCHLCIAIHPPRLAALQAGPALIAALRAGDPVPDERLDA